VNVASYCGYTYQYEGLEKLYTTYKDKLVVIGFPANNFKNQEPDSNEKIQDFCRKDKGVTFPLAKKVSVAGEDIHPLFKYLVEEAKKLDSPPDPVIRWNFTKFLVDENGKLVKVFGSKTEPMSEDITKYLN
jgi:glutathione peroxidase